MRRYTIVLGVYLILAIFYSKGATIADVINPKVLPLDNERILVYNYSLYDKIPFYILPGINRLYPDPHEVCKHLSPILGEHMLYTQMILSDIYPYPDPQPLYSSMDYDPAIILISPRKTEMRVRGLVNLDYSIPVVKTELVSLSIPDSNNKNEWVVADEFEENNFIYHRDGEWHIITFSENKTDEFRCVKLKIVQLLERIDSDGQINLINSQTYRTWLFIQLPWTDNPAIFDFIPYRNHSIYPEQPKSRTTEEVLEEITRLNLNVVPEVIIPDTINKSYIK